MGLGGSSQQGTSEKSVMVTWTFPEELIKAMAWYKISHIKVLSDSGTWPSHKQLEV